jgi:O-antigen/teichoic acid export membrane protein
MRSVMQALLIAVGRQDRVLRMTGWTALFTLALNVVLIPRWGMMAAAAMTVAGEGVRMGLAHRYVREAGVAFGGAVRLLPACIATMLAVGALLVLEPRSVLVGISLGGAIYLAPFALFAVWSRRGGQRAAGS